MGLRVHIREQAGLVFMLEKQAVPLGKVTPNEPLESLLDIKGGRVAVEDRVV